MDDHPHEYLGTVYVLPASGSFELQTTVHGAPLVVHGIIAQQVLARFEGNAADRLDPTHIALRPRRVEVVTRELHERHRAPRHVHYLTRVDEVEEQAQPVPYATV